MQFAQGEGNEVYSNRNFIPEFEFLIHVIMNLIIPVLQVSMVVLGPVFGQPPLRLSALS